MKRTLLLVILLLLLALRVGAQEFTVDPNANMSWPPSVYTLRGQFELRGTANLPNMTSYFLEYRQLNDDLTANESAPWVPATLPSNVKVVDGVLGAWNTTIVADGVYEIRMTIGVSSGSPVYVLVSPVRVENTPPPFSAVATQAPVPVLATNTPEPQEPPTLVPSPTALDLTPRAEIVTGANVRSGDSTFYPIILGLVTGEIVPVVGISNTGSGWYLIELPSGRRGWVAPSVVRISGDVRNVPRVSPPPPPPPTATPTPLAQANLVITSLSLSPDPPRCNQAFTITARVYNAGTGPTSTGGTLLAQDVHAASGTTGASTNGAFPALNAGQTFDAEMRLTVDTYFEETHRLTVIVDSNAQILETNEGDNAVVREYTLRRADCG